MVSTSARDRSAADPEEVLNRDARLGRLGPLLVAGLALAAGSAALWYFYSHGWSNICGDGISRLNGTRKLLDWEYPNFWSRYLQIGSPWLPLPYFLMAPFVANEWLWRTGLAGSIVSGAAFVLGAVGVFRHARLLYRPEPARDHLALVAAAVFALNPSLLYLQTTPMTESLFVATLAWALYLMQEWVFSRRAWALLGSAGCLVLAELTRYEAWSLAPFAGLAVLALSPRRGRRRMIDGALWGAPVVAVWLYWFWHNWAVSGNWLEFYNGYYSAKMIYARQAAQPWTTGSVKWTLTEGLGTVLACAGLLTVILGLTGAGAFVSRRRRELHRYAPTFLYIFPLLFHLYSLYTGNIRVQVFLGLENVRYGLPYLVPLALFVPGAALLAPRRRAATLAVVAGLVLLGYGNVWREGVHSIKVFQEPYAANYINPEWQARYAVARYIAGHPPEGRTLLDVQAEGVVAPAGLQFRALQYYLNEQWQPDSFRPLTDDKQLIVVQDESSLAAALRDPAVNRTFQQVFSAGRGPSFSVWRRAPRS